MNLPPVIKIQAVTRKLPDLIKVSNKIYKVKE
jgi:hypothetical protein